MGWGKPVWGCCPGGGVRGGVGGARWARGSLLFGGLAGCGVVVWCCLGLTLVGPAVVGSMGECAVWVGGLRGV